MQLTVTASKQIEQLPRHLHREFPNTSVSVIEHEIEERVRRLASSAHFDDYIPLLVHRTVREALRSTN